MDINSPSWFVLSQKAAVDLQQSALIPALVFTSLAFIIVLLRWYSRMSLAPGTWHAEDFFITAALLLSVGMTAVVGAEFGLEITPARDEESTLRRLPRMLKAHLIFAQSLLYQLAINLVKTGFTFQYLRIFSHLRYPRYLCYLLFLLILAISGWGVFGIIFLCNPVKTYWDVKAEGRCANPEHHFFGTSIVGIVIDWAIWVLPMPIVGKLRLPRRQKWGLWSMFGLGGFVCIVSILRLALVHEAVHTGELAKSGVYAVVWSTIELNVAIICASLLVMKPLFAKWIPAIVSEQPVSARRDRRVLTRLTGLALLNSGFMEEEQPMQEQGRRDTAVAGLDYGRRSDCTQLPARVEDFRSHRSSITTNTTTGG